MNPADSHIQHTKNADTHSYKKKGGVNNAKYD